MNNYFMGFIGAQFVLASIWYMIDGQGIKSVYCLAAAVIQLTVILMQ